MEREYQRQSKVGYAQLEGKHLFWYEMHDDTNAVIESIGFGHSSLSCFDGRDNTSADCNKYSYFTRARRAVGEAERWG